MSAPPSPRRLWVIRTAVIIAAGVLSRLIPTGVLLFDKYLGDALYAAMVYALCRLRFSTNTALPSAAFLMAAIEAFQLTGIPARLFASPHLPVHLFSRLLGTHFSCLDLLAYAAGITAIYLADRHLPVITRPAPLKSARP